MTGLIESYGGFPGTADAGKKEGEMPGDAEQAAWASESKGNQVTLKNIEHPLQGESLSQNHQEFWVWSAQ